MKIIKTILYILLALIIGATGFIIACFINPNLASSIGDKLYKNKSANVSEEPAEDNYTPPESGEEYVPSDNETEAEYTEDEDAEEVDYLSDIQREYTPEYDLSVDGSYPFSSLPYSAPSESQLNVPDVYIQKSGLVIPIYTREDLDDPVAQQVEDDLGVGQTGEGLDFSALFYPYYHMLNDKGKELYRQIYANANAVNGKFAPVTECNQGEVSKAMQAVFCDHPELFWLNTAYNLRCKRNGQVAAIDLSFNETADNLPIAKNEFESAANEILTNAYNLGSDFEKEKYVHDALADRIDYQLSAPMNQSAYSALVNDSTVCAGYARAYQYLLNKLSIPCYYCMGYAGENHAWNIVNLDEDYYNVDVTWDDADPTNYDFFNKTDSDYSTNHIRKDLSVNLPACNGTKYQVGDSGEQNIAEPSDDDSANTVIIQIVR